MHYDLIVRNALIARSTGDTEEGDLACRGSRIEKIDSTIDAPGREEIDARGLLLLPGVIDPQVHFREPGACYKEDLGSGSRAAVRGGVTSFLEMPNTRPATTSQPLLDQKLQLAAQKSVANYGFFIGATTDNLKAINSVTPACGIKIFMGASTGDLLVDKHDDLERIFANGRRLIAVHAEDEQRIQHRKRSYLQDPAPDISLHSVIRDPECALQATRLAVELSQQYQRRLHILHLSTTMEVDYLRQHKTAWITAEVIPNHLLLNTADYKALGSLVQMNPPIRETKDNTALWQGLHDGIIDFIATDHAPHTLEEKKRPYPDSPSGMPGVETSLPLLLTAMQAGHCTLREILKWFSAGPAAAYKIDNKGHIEEGYDADFTLVDMEHSKPLHNADVFSRAGWSPFAGRSLTGWPLYTIVNGQIVYEKGNIRPGILGKALSFDHGAI